ncbi:MAG: hypothetical protein F4Z50_06125, partial [Gemmatimonadetes bacterium]|nr:hypothetical protein [Gemmatimonadota bacterium]
MVDPTLALLIFAALAALFAAILWPGRGLAARLRRFTRLTERVRMEDVLKQLYKLEYDRLPATVESVAGGVQIPRSQAVRLLQRLEEKRLVTAAASDFRLTDPGKTQALHIVRTHRLWERFLADRTGTRPEEWHERAEEHEHLITAAEADDLASALGHPVYDPHGDPIPTAEGEMPARTGVPLSSLAPGERGLITHLEDEPEEVYRELVGLGLGLMTPVERLRGEAGRVSFRTGAKRFEVSSALARNVTVELSSEVADPHWSRTLADVVPGDSATVAGISPRCRGPARRRLLDLGVVPGTVIHARMKSAGGDPVAYDIRG